MIRKIVLPIFGALIGALIGAFIWSLLAQDQEISYGFFASSMYILPIIGAFACAWLGYRLSNTLNRYESIAKRTYLFIAYRIVGIQALISGGVALLYYLISGESIHGVSNPILDLSYISIGSLTVSLLYIKSKGYVTDEHKPHLLAALVAILQAALSVVILPFYETIGKAEGSALSFGDIMLYIVNQSAALLITWVIAYFTAYLFIRVLIKKDLR